MSQAGWNEGLRRAAIVLSLGFLATMLGLFAIRVGHPFLLEWQEGAMVDQVARVLGGRSLYAEPAVEFIAQIYAPLYFYASAALALVVGVDFLALRIVSIASTLGVLACMAAFVHGETGSRWAVVLSLGLFAATYPLAAAFLDVGRVDALFLFLCMAGVLVVRHADSPRAMVGAAALFVLAFSTKQQGMLFSVAMTAWVAFARGWRPALLLAGVFGLGAVAALWALERSSEGWASFYLFALPGSHAFVWPLFFTFWLGDMARPLAPACLLAAGWLVFLFRERRTQDAVFWLMFLGVCTATALGSRMHWGGASNVLLPAYMGVALCWGVALHAVLESRPPRVRLLRVAWVVCVLQLVWLVYDPRTLVPRAADRAAGDAFVEVLAGLDGDVLATWHGHLPRLAGKRVFAHRSAIHDVMRSDRAVEIARLDAAFDRAFEARRFGAVVVDQPYFLRDYEKRWLEGRYRHAGPLLEEGLEVGGLLGYRANPHLYLPVTPPVEASSPGSDGRRR